MGKQQSRDRQDAEFENSKPKNVNAASVAESTALQTKETCPDLLAATVTGVESIPEQEIGNYFSNDHFSFNFSKILLYD